MAFEQTCIFKENLRTLDQGCVGPQFFTLLSDVQTMLDVFFGGDRNGIEQLLRSRIKNIARPAIARINFLASYNHLHNSPFPLLLIVLTWKYSQHLAYKNTPGGM